MRRTLCLVATAASVVSMHVTTGAGIMPLMQTDLAIRETPSDLTMYVANARKGLMSGRTTERERSTIALQPFSDCGEFQRPIAVAVRGDRLIVVDAASPPRVVDCNVETRATRVLLKGEPLRLPSSVAIAADGRIAVSDRELRGLILISSEGEAKPTRPVEFAASVRADERGVLYVLDEALGSIVQFNAAQREYEQSDPKSRLTFPLRSETTSFAVFRDVLYTAESPGVRVSVSGGSRLSFPVPYVRARSANIAVSEHYLAVLDGTEETTVDVIDRPLPVEVSLDHLEENPNVAWLALLTYLAERQVLPNRLVRMDAADTSYDSVLTRNVVLIRQDLSPKLSVPTGAANALFCSLNAAVCGSGFSSGLKEVVIPQATLQSSLETGSVPLAGRSARSVVDERVLLPEQKTALNDDYLARINPDAGRTLEAEFSRLGLVAATPMNPNLRPGTVIRVVDQHETIVGPLSMVCPGTDEPTVSRTSVATALSVPASSMPPEFQRPGAERVTVRVTGWRRETVSLTSLAKCQPDASLADAFVIVEAYAATEVRLDAPVATAATRQRAAPLVINGPIYLGYKPIRISALAAGITSPVSDPQTVKASAARTGTASLWNMNAGTFTLPVTRWTADVLVPARDYYASEGPLAELRKAHSGLELSARERLRLSAQSFTRHDAIDWPNDVERTVIDYTMTLREVIGYSKELADASGAESVTVGIIERSQSVNLDHQGFDDPDDPAWYDLTDGGLQRHLRPPPAPALAGAPPPSRPQLRKLVVATEHGTHVAGIIGGRKSALSGGLAPKVNLVLVPGDSFADLKTVIKRARDHGVFIYNISQTFPPGNDNELNTLAKRLGEWQNSLFIVAAGNKEGSGDPNINAGEPPAPVRWAAKFRNVIGVAAADRLGNDVLGDHRDPDGQTLNPGSNYGSLYVDLLAPGELVCSLGRSDYAYGCGSSLAAPQISAAAAMLWTRLPSPERLRARLLYTADWRSLYLGKAWGGMLNVRRALSFLETNVLTLASEGDPHEVVIEGTPQMRIDGEEYLRDGTHPAANVTVPFNRILRMVPEAGGEHRVVYQDDSGRIHIAQGRMTGKVTCKSLTHFDAVNGRFGATPHERAMCQRGIDAGQIADYVASTPGSVQFQ